MFFRYFFWFDNFYKNEGFIFSFLFEERGEGKEFRSRDLVFKWWDLCVLFIYNGK